MNFLSNYKSLILGIIIGGIMLFVGDKVKVAGILFQSIFFGIGAAIIFYGIFTQIKEWKSLGNYPLAKLFNRKKQISKTKKAKIMK